jgi:hypothetical protein
LLALLRAYGLLSITRGEAKCCDDCEESHYLANV